MDIKKMVDRFLGWKLPDDFAPDAGISLNRTYTDNFGMPTGTNLLHAGQAEEMFRYCLAEETTPVPTTAQQSVSEQSIEQEIQAKGLTAPRVTQADITANIAGVEYVTHVSKSGQVLRWAVLTTQNGFAVTGRPSVAVSKENDNEEIGRQVAYENARGELWPLMGYALKEKLASA